MRNLLSIRAKAKACYTCQECGSQGKIHTHHEIPGDDNSIVVLCASCHAKKHPDVPLELFLNSCNKRRSPYWQNKSAASLAKRLSIHPRTIIRRAKKFGIPRGELKPLDEELIKIKTIKGVEGHSQTPSYSFCKPRSPNFKLVQTVPMEKVVIDLSKTQIKTYSMRRAGTKTLTVLSSLPREPLEREAGSLGLTLKEFMHQYEAVWYYGDLPGLYLTFQEKENKAAPSDPSRTSS